MTSRRVLVVDVDPQGAAAACLGTNAAKPTLADVLVDGRPAIDAVRAGRVLLIPRLPFGWFDAPPADTHGGRPQNRAADAERSRQDAEALVALIAPHV